MQSIIDLDLYPLDRPQSPQWRTLVARARDDLARDGMFNLPGFFRPEALAAAGELLPKFGPGLYPQAPPQHLFPQDDQRGCPPIIPRCARWRR